MRIFGLTCLLVALFAFPAVPVLAQTNPAPATCGFPAGVAGARTFHSTATYTLTDHCQQSWRLSCDKSAATDSPVTITINGAGKTITAYKDNQGNLDVFRFTGKCALVLNNVTIAGGGYQDAASVLLTNPDVASSFTNVTFTGTDYIALRISDQRENSPGTTHTLDNVLFANTTGRYFSTAHGMPSALQTIGKVNLNINNLALRNVRGGNSAIGANDTYIVGRRVSIGTIRLTGCLTVDGVFPRVWYGNIVDNSAGPCSDAVGNEGSGSAAIQYPQAPNSACGLPLSGFIYGKHTFSLDGDCALTGPLYIPYESEVVINGNGRTINAAAVETAMHTAGPLLLSNAVISGAQNSPVITYLNNRATIANAEFRNNAGALVLQDGPVTLSRTLVENHSVASGSPASAVSVLKSARVDIRDSVFRGNSGGQGALNAGAPFRYGANPATTLAGCITFDSNTPTDIIDASSLLRDSRTGPCPPDMIFLGVYVPPTPTTAGNAPVFYFACPADEICICGGIPGAVPIGAAACVFREDGKLSVYGIDEQSRGFFLVEASRQQVNANGIGMVASSPDGFAAVYKMEGGDVKVSIGPDSESKLLHATFDGGVKGAVIDTHTTYAPAPELADAAPTAVARAEVTQAETGATALQGCMVTTQYILNFRDAPAGNVKYFLPYDVTLTAIERTADWFNVDYHGERGWIHADYVEPQGDCALQRRGA